jgi:hypothetical protein
MLNMQISLLIPQSFCILWRKIFNISDSYLRPYFVYVSYVATFGWHEKRGGATKSADTRENWPVIDNYLLFLRTPSQVPNINIGCFEFQFLFRSCYLRK